MVIQEATFVAVSDISREIRVRLNIIARSLENCCSVKVAMHSESIVDLHATANNLKILSCTKFYLSEIIFPATIKRTQFVMCSDRYFCRCSNKIMSFFTDFHKNSKYKISRKSDERNAYTCLQTDRWRDRHDEATRQVRHHTNAPKNTMLKLRRPQHILTSY